MILDKAGDLARMYQGRGIDPSLADRFEDEALNLLFKASRSLSLAPCLPRPVLPRLPLID